MSRHRPSPVTHHSVAPLVWGFGLGAFTAGCAAWLVYGALVEAKKLVLEEHTLELPLWPAEKNGYRIALIADLHVRDEYTVEMAQRAVDLALAQAPDMIVIAGDLVGYWRPESPWLLERALSKLTLTSGHVLAIPGNHDYWGADAGLLYPILDHFGIRLLRNELWRQDGIAWVGIDSGNMHMDDAAAAMHDLQTPEPAITLWHEPDFVDQLPAGTALMLSGHSHGGQWRFPWGWTPMRARGGKKYVAGFYRDTSTPLFVTRGVGTTGPPARLGALAEVTLLTLVSAS